MNIADISLIISYHMEWLNRCDVHVFLWFEKIGYFHRTEQKKTKIKIKPAKKLRKGLGKRLDVTPKDAVRAPGSTFQKVAFLQPTRVR